MLGCYSHICTLSCTIHNYLLISVDFLTNSGHVVELLRSLVFQRLCILPHFTTTSSVDRLILGATVTPPDNYYYFMGVQIYPVQCTKYSSRRFM